MKIVGVVHDMKNKGDYAGPNPVFQRVDTSNLNGGALPFK